MGDQADGVRRLTAATARIGRSGRDAAEHLDAELNRAGQPGARIALLDVALAEIDRIAAEIEAVDLGRPDALVGPLRGAHDDLDSALARARTKLADGRALIEPMRAMLAGPSHYLLLAANNSEMAGGSGLALSAGVLTFDDGEIELGEVVAAGDLRLDQSVALPADLAAVYRPTGVGIDFRSATRSPDLEAMGPVLSEMARRAGLDGVREIDGVLVVDAVALQRVMEISGPVDVRGRSITADDVLAEVLHDNYTQYETSDDRPERVSYQGDIARAVFDSLTERDVPAAKLATALVDAGAGRHLMAWSADGAVQDVWRELRMAGNLDERGLLISFQNYAANKLDWYLRPRAALDVSLLPSGDYRARLDLEMEVPDRAALTDASPYILGPTPDRQGTFVTVHLPAAAYDITTPDPPGFRTRGVESGMPVRTFLVDVPMGSTLERTVEFSLPREHGAMLLLPSARLEPLELTVDGVTTVDDARARVISWLVAEPTSADADRDVPTAAGLAALAGIVTTSVAVSMLVLAARRRSRATDVDALVSLGRLVAKAGLALCVLAALVGAMAATPTV